MIAIVKNFGCKDHPNECISIQEAIELPLIPKCRANLNVTILIGLFRWRLGMKRLEVQAFLRTKGIHISTGSISNRSLDFLLLFKQLHKSKTDKMKDLLDRLGGIILHVDGTHKSGGRVVYVLQEGLKDIVIAADLIATESEENVNPILLKFKECYGSPLVIVRDMAKGPALSASNIFPDSPQQICQIHFIRDLEKDLITKHHKELKSSIVKHKLTSNLGALRDSDEIPDDIINRLQLRWVHIAVDYLLHPIKKRVKWISRPISYFAQYRRIKEVSGLVRRLVLWNASQNYFCTSVMKLDTYLRSVLEDSEALRCYYLLDRTLRWLDDLRDHLRISRENHLKDFSQDEIDLENILEDINEVLVRIRKEGRELGGKYNEIATEINNAFDRHWDGLFVPDPIVNGKIISFHRHNNGLESSHRRTRKAIRERTGRAETNREMEQFGDLLAILSNLWNETYQKEILNDVDNLGYRLSQFVNDLPRLRKEYRDARKGPEIPIADDKRICILEDFVQALESSNLQNNLVFSLQSILRVEAGIGMFAEV